MAQDKLYAGYVDKVRYRTVFGWLRDELEPEHRPVLQVRINGDIAGFCTPCRARPDLAEAGAGDRYFGFEFAIPDSIERIGSVQVLVEEAGFELPWSSDDGIGQTSNRALPPEWRARTGGFCMPSFFLIGAADAGTTSLHGYLRQHPGICMSEPEEPYFFEAEYESGAAFYFNRYFSHWNNETVVGEARNRNLYLPHVPPRIHRFNPDAKFIAILRNPAERAISHWWRRYSRGLEALDLREAISADLARINSGRTLGTIPERELHKRGLGVHRKACCRTYLDSGYYYAQLERYIALFPPERLWIILFDDLTLDPRKVTAEAIEFLGADADYAGRIEYSMLSPASPAMLEHINDTMLSWLADHYREHNERLEAFLNRSLQSWNSPFAR